MRVRLGNRYWTLRFSGNLKDFGSMQDGGTADSRIIRIGTWQGEQDTLDTVIHEALHCSRPELVEQGVGLLGLHLRPEGAPSRLQITVQSKSLKLALS